MEETGMWWKRSSKKAVARADKNAAVEPQSFGGASKKGPSKQRKQGAIQRLPGNHLQCRSSIDAVWWPAGLRRKW